ncbi:hypothetical protein BA899_01930 [Spiribacter sp. SSL99]|uniref:PEP-utilizing enzyme n=1 Tax=Spiribacter sp. SSL99 TaxID=1866884 RepID=UPI00132FCD2E|nr:PEP-utilizing enzyme [Spiribacter sp. SSL99]KAF0285746.1 hypothetical protein BA899_01930 [Spiribacter sp. SSL99]
MPEAGETGIGAPTSTEALVFLGAGRPQRGDTHSALREAGTGARVMDWLLQAFAGRELEVQFVGGYQLEAIAERYPDFRYIENPKWEETGSAASLLRADMADLRSLFVSYSDILYRSDAVAALGASDAPVTVAVDSRWKDRYRGRPAEDILDCEKVNLADGAITRLGVSIDPDLADAEFIGLVRFSGDGIAALGHLRDSLPTMLARANLSELIEWLRVRGLSVQAVDVAGGWAELNEPRDLAHFVLGTKAETLDRLRGLVRHSQIEDQVAFTVTDWERGSDSILARIQRAFADPLLVVRSSALSEDGFTCANAGAYTSVLSVPREANHELRAAIEQVVASYADGNPDNQVLVQPMVADVTLSGVVFTRTLAHGAPYYAVNYDDISGSTETITSGSSEEHKTLVIRRDRGRDLPSLPAGLEALVPALEEIELLVDYDALDVEFAMSASGSIHILQVRPIAVEHSSWDVEDKAVYGLLAESERRFEALQRPSPFVVGRRTLFGVMPDWNPAEIIGTKPGRLAMSLYRRLIMDEVWATQRAEYGYRDVRPQPLLVTFAGRPYVDVRASFNSLVPAALEDRLAGRLVDFYQDWLARHPDLHDKVEFEVVPTCFALDFGRWEQRLAEHGAFTSQEIGELREGLRTLTREGMTRNVGDLDSIAVLETRFEQLRSADLPPLEQAYLLLEDCRARGTLAFAHLARNAFVAVTLLRSAVYQGVINQSHMDDFLASIRTVSHGLTADARATAVGELHWDAFVARYGHLRPGTYDITSSSYAADPERYLRPIVARAQREPAGGSGPQPGRLWQRVRSRFAEALGQAGLEDDPERIEQFMREAIEGREYAKFAFSRNLSLGLDALQTWGREHGVDRDALSQIGIEDLLELRTGAALVEEPGSWLRGRADEGAAWRHRSAVIELPPLIRERGDFSIFTYPSSQANFIGSGRVVAPCVDLAASADDPDLTGKIALIPQADPGYDWLFGKEIAGLITLYGGANSHMAIRAAEFGLPAAIGVGETRYKALSGASVLELHAGNQQIHVVQ